MRRNTYTESKYFVYALIDPRDDQPFYVGLTTDTQRRYRQHLRERHDSFKVYAVMELLEHGVTPRLEVIDDITCDKRTAEQLESLWILEYKKRGHNLMNVLTSAGTPHSTTDPMWHIQSLKRISSLTLEELEAELFGLF